MQCEPSGNAILYVASRLPELSETFVYRELLGLRGLGRTVLGASIRKPNPVIEDASMEALARESTIVYSFRTAASLPAAAVRYSLHFTRALSDAVNADHKDLKGRVKHLFQAWMGISLGWRLRARGIGHVHAHMAHVPATVGLYAARVLGASFSFTGHAADLFVNRSGLRFKLLEADFVASISHWHQQFYRETAGLGLDRTPLVRCSVALPSGQRPRDTEVVTVARLVPKKGIDLLIRAFALAGLPDWSLRIVGDGSERAKLEQLVDQLGMRALVQFDGARPHVACLEAIAGAGMFVLPCRTAADGDKDGIPVVLMEAMAAARPVICGDLPTIRELVTNEETGLLVPPNEVDPIVDAMRRIANDGHFADRLGADARNLIQHEFSDQLNLDRLCRAIDQAKAEHDCAG